MSETPVNHTPENKPNDKELNFRVLEQKLSQERSARLEAEKGRMEAEKQIENSKRYVKDDVDDDDESEPYVDHKKLNKKLQKFGQQAMQETQSEIKIAVQNALKEERKQNWLKSNPDFFDVLQKAEEFANEVPDLAEAILEMPDSFERQKLVYKNIKALGLNQPKVKQSTIQEKIDANRKSPYYQPSGVGSAPYATAGDFSVQGQKQAHAKMKELQNRLRLG